MIKKAGCRHPRRRTGLDEVRRFLDTWYFFVTDSGLFYARPRKYRISPSEFRSFMRRLDIVCRDGIPKTIVIDVSRLISKEQFWTNCNARVHRFARRTHSHVRFEENDRHAAVIIWRREAALPLHFDSLAKSLAHPA